MSRFLKYFRQKKLRKNWRFFSNKAKLFEILIITLFFLEKRHFFHQKLAKIAENCDYNIDPSCDIGEYVCRYVMSYPVMKRMTVVMVAAVLTTVLHIDA
jgi:ABC-type antimicrobial peptide transport system ATPase subunit